MTSSVEKDRVIQELLEVNRNLENKLYILEINYIELQEQVQTIIRKDIGFFRRFLKFLGLN